MPTLSQKVDDLNRTVTQIGTQAAYLEERDREHTAYLNRLRDENTDLRERVAKLEQVVAELKGNRDVWGQRAWGLAAGIVLALLSGAVGYYIKR